MIEINAIYNIDAIDLLKQIETNSVNLVLCDLPYKETGNKWDIPINLKEFFEECERITTEDGAIVLTGTFKFGTKLYAAAPHLYKYDWVWEKDNGTNVPSVNYQPFRIHEYIYVFGKGRASHGKRTAMKYHPQKTQGKPYSHYSGKESENWKGGLAPALSQNLNGLRHPKTIQKWTRDRGLHPTQKPVEMFEYLIRTYTDEGDLVVDICAGSGTTAVAAVVTNRNYIVNDNEKRYHEIMVQRISEL